MAIDSDVLVIGGGLAGITAALSAARKGVEVRLVSHKESTLLQASGLIDALGYVPATEPVDEDPTATPTAGRSGPRTDRPEPRGPLADPFDAIEALPAGHPYRIVGGEALREGLALFDDVVDSYRGGHTDRNALVPTAGGAVKPTARYPAAVESGLASDDRPMLIVGCRRLTNFDAGQVATHLEAGGVPFAVAGREIEFPGEFRDDAGITRFAHALDRDEAVDGRSARAALADAVGRAIDDVPHDVERVGLPPMLGDDQPAAVRAELANHLGTQVFEIPSGPPSLPGLRLADELYDALDAAGVRYETGVPVVDARLAGSRAATSAERVAAALVDRKGSRVPYEADAVVLATGGLVGKGVESDREAVREPVLGCHVPHPEDRYEWFVDDAFGAHPYARFGVRTDDRLRPLGPDGDVQYANVRVAGATLGGADVAREKSASGVSLATGVVAGREAAMEVES
jgi:glycerol-3-phosphate dehydrogenase subunit B